MSDERLPALRLHGGEAAISVPLPRWPRLAPSDATSIIRCLTEQPWALGQADCPPGGLFKKRFEEDFAAQVGTRFALGVASGTTALDLAFEALAVPDDRLVVAASYGHPATIQRAARTHRLLLLDVDPDTLCLAPAEVGAALRRGDIGCVIMTDFAGQPAGAPELRRLCDEAGVPLMEDASHAHGARLGGRAAGSFGRLGCFSLHATKNLPAAEGGVIATDDEALYRWLWRAHDLGRDPGGGPYAFQSLGGNHRLSEIHAALAMAEMPHLIEHARQRMVRIDEAHRRLAGGPLELLPRAPGVELHAHHLVPARYRAEAAGGVSRHRFALALSAEGVPCHTGWPAPLAALPALRARCLPHPTPVTEGAIATSLWLDRRLFDQETTAERVPEAVAKVVAQAPRLARGRGER
jgi:dTDP-4-amino-4,6-dideoxygalactose transaminase